MAFFFLCLALPWVCFGYQQQYVSGDSSQSTQASQQPQQAASGNPMDIYLHPHPHVAPQKQSEANHKNALPNIRNPYVPVTPSKNSANAYSQSQAKPYQNPSWQATQEKALQQTYERQQYPLPRKKLSSSSLSPSAAKTSHDSQRSKYTLAEKQAWFDHCLNAITNKKVSAFAKDFCQCGWQHIRSGELPAKLLISHNQQDLNKANKRLQVISQLCMVQVMAKIHGGSAPPKK